MASTRINPEKITSPFQLMAAWFAMLVLLVSILLAAAAKITKPDWASGYLIIAASILIILVLGCVTLMLTVFRPHLQEGKEYAQWLKDRNSYSAGLVRAEGTSAAPKRRRDLHATEDQDDGQKDFLIEITNMVGATRLVRSLSKAGYLAQIYNRSSDVNNKLEHHEAIWIGRDLPVREAVKAIKVALSEWKRLKYMHLSNDSEVEPPSEVHYQMYLGGSSSTAIEYGLSPWSNSELLNLDEGMSQLAFHQIIRQKYS